MNRLEREGVEPWDASLSAAERSCLALATNLAQRAIRDVNPPLVLAELLGLLDKPLRDGVIRLLEEVHFQWIRGGRSARLLRPPA